MSDEQKIAVGDALGSGDFYMRTLLSQDGAYKDGALVALGQFMVTRWPTIRIALEESLK